MGEARARSRAEMVFRADSDRVVVEVYGWRAQREGPATLVFFDAGKGRGVRKTWPVVVDRDKDFDRDLTAPPKAAS